MTERAVIDGHFVLVLGQRPETGVGAVDIEMPSMHTKARDLVRVAVEEQVRTLMARRTFSAAEIRQRLGRQYGEIRENHPLTEAAIGVPELDVEREVERALDACRRGACVVVIDGHPATDLDEELKLCATSRVSFLRLIPLTGG